MYETSSVDGSTSTNFDTEHFGRGQKQNFNQRVQKSMRGTQRTRLICLCLGHNGIITENLIVRAGCT